ncbi:hypothetical protein D3C72_1823250 [compost metagenome]
MENKSNIEENSLINITDDKREIESILDMLKTHSVTPVAINDIISDMQCQNN